MYSHVLWVLTLFSLFDWTFAALEGMHLITTVFDGYSISREKEIYSAIWKNIELEEIEKVIALNVKVEENHILFFSLSSMKQLI